MEQHVIDELNKEGEPSEFHKALLDHVKRLVKISRSSMSQCYPDWDMQHAVYRGEMMLDKEDRDNERKGKPTKMVVPNTFAQCMTFTSFLFLMFNQNRTFYELSPSGPEDAGTKRSDCETILQRDLRHNQWNSILFQHLLDISKFGLGIIESSWTRKISRVYAAPAPAMVPSIAGPVAVENPSQWLEFVKFEGNAMRAVSPYHFFPDTRKPLTEWQTGEFCAVEECYSMVQLREMEAAGEVAGVDYIRPLPQNWDELRGGVTRSIISANTQDFVWNNRFNAKNDSHNALVTKCQVWIVPYKFTFGPNDRKLGPEEFPVLYHVWYANDDRLIRAEPAGNWHNEFGWSIAQFTPDMHCTVNLGLADLIYRLQDVISWFVNSHISSVRRVMQNRIIVDPRIIDTTTLDGEKDIYLRKGVTVPNLERAVGQLRVQDVTGQHMGDMELLQRLMEVVTGVNGNAMGQYNSGRRSAQEARVVTAGAAGRMKMHGHLIWESALGRHGRLMLSNSRQELSYESFKWAIGQPADLDARFAAFKGTPEEIVCGDDFMVFDSTLASEKGFMAQSLQELFSVLLQSNPMLAQQLGMKLDPMKLMNEMFYLRGTGDVNRFGYDPAQQAAMQQMMQAQMLAQQQAAGAPAVA